MRRGFTPAVVVLLSAAHAHAQDAPPGGGALEDLDRASRTMVERCGPAVVRVEADRPLLLRATDQDPVARRTVEDSLRAQGARESVAAAGFLVEDEGLVFTTSSVAGGGATEIRVTFPGRGSRDGTLVGEDALAGVALVRVGPVEGVRRLCLAEGTPPPGALTLLLAPSFQEAPTLHMGFVTEPRRAFGFYDAWLVSSVPVSPGHAGAPLLDARGAVLGIAVKAREPVEDASTPRSRLQDVSRSLRELLERTGRTQRAAPFSTFVPAGELRRILAELRERGTMRRGMVGVRLASAEPILREVIPGGPAETAGLRTGDRVAAVDGIPVESGARFGAFIQRRAPGTSVRLRIASAAGPEREAVVVLGELPPAPAPVLHPGLFNGLSVRAEERAPDLAAAKFSAEVISGGRWIMVTGVEEGSAASAAGIAVGDWIVEIEGRPLLSDEDYLAAAAGGLAGRPEVRVMFYRPGEAERRTVVLK